MPPPRRPRATAKATNEVPVTSSIKIKSDKQDNKPTVKESNRAVSGKNAKLVTTTSVSNRLVEQTLEFEAETTPERGSDAMFDAIFKAAKVGSRLTQDDLDQIEQERTEFWGRKVPKTKAAKIPESTMTSSKSTLNGENNKCHNDLDDSLDFSDDQETLDLLAEAEALINGIDLQSSFNENSPMDVMDVDTELEAPKSEEADEIDPLGELVFFQVQLKAVKYPIRIRQHSKIEEVRKMVSKKSGVDADCITMFFGDYTKLADCQTVHECGLTDLCNVDAYYIEKTDKELYLADSMDIFRFKLQTADRRGRQTVFIYSKKTEPMRNVRDQYAKAIGIDPSQLRLMFDGDHINLDMLPEDCDLEGEECLDVIIKQ